MGNAVVDLATPLTSKDQVRWFVESFDLPPVERERFARGVESAFNDGLRSGYQQAVEKKNE